jgi:hypothetical protein
LPIVNTNPLIIKRLIQQQQQQQQLLGFSFFKAIKIMTATLYIKLQLLLLKRDFDTSK